MYKKYYKLSLAANPDLQHYASQCHHYWPDIARNAMIDYWDDSSALLDDKWDFFFNSKIPETQRLISENLKLSQPKQIVFAGNFCEFFQRILSCFIYKKNISILTTDSEYYGFDNFAYGFHESSVIEIEKVTTLPFDNFEERIIAKIKSHQYEIIFLSHVFFNSGMAVKKLEQIIKAVQDSETMVIIDGSHSFMALPTDLSLLESRIFYFFDSSKYAQGGEGACFLHVPKSSPYSSLFTNWFAKPIMDFSAIYRLQAVLSLFKNDKLSVEKIHAHILLQQNNFRDHLLSIGHHYLCEKNILSVDYQYHGPILTFAMPSPEHSKKLYEELRAKNIRTDYCSSRLRFGFGLYQNDCIDLSAFKN